MKYIIVYILATLWLTSCNILAILIVEVFNERKRKK